MPIQQGIMSAYQLMAHTHQTAIQGGQLDHGAALVGHADDDHMRYFDRDASKLLIGVQRFDAQSVTINAGVITPTRSYILIDSEGGAASDNLDTINGGMGGQIIFIRAAHAAHTIVVRHGVGNINCANLGDINLDGINRGLFFMYYNETSIWEIMTYSHLLTKARIDALNINADQLDGEEAAAIVTNARVKAHFPDTIANILSNHSKAIHDALGILHSSTGGRTANDHHAQLHKAEHEVGGGDLVNHDALTGFVAAEHVSLPNTIANVLSNHTKAIHDALALAIGSLNNDCVCRAYLNGNQAIPNATDTKVLFDAENYDVGNNFDADGVDSNFLVPSNGKYLIMAQIKLSGGMSGLGQIMIYIDASKQAEAYDWAEGTEIIKVFTIEDLSAGDSITIKAKQTSGGAIVIEAGREDTFICIQKIGV